MGEITELFVVLGVVYFLECLQVVPRAAAAVHTLGRRFRLQSTTRLGLKPGSGLLAGMPLPPLGLLFVVERWPVRLGRDELTGEDGVARPWAELKDVATEETRVLAGGVLVARMASEAAAQSLAAWLQKIARAKPAERERIVDGVLAARLDAGRARERVAGFWRASWPLLASENLLFLAIFVGGPLVLATELVAWWPVAAGAALAGWIATLVTFALARRATFGAPPLSRLFSFALWPVGAMRASDVLGRPLLADLDPLAAATLLPRAAFRDAARRALAELRHGETRGWHEERLDRAVVRLLRDQKIDPDELFAPPPPDDATVVAFCPRCRAQYVREVERCLSCPAIRLLPLAR